MAVMINNWPRRLTLQSIMPSLNHCDLPRHVGVNNLPKVVTGQRHGRELNSQLASCKSNALATRLPNQCVVTPVGIVKVIWSHKVLQQSPSGLRVATGNYVIPVDDKKTKI